MSATIDFKDTFSETVKEQQSRHIEVEMGPSDSLHAEQTVYATSICRTVLSAFFAWDAVRASFYCGLLVALLFHTISGIITLFGLIFLLGIDALTIGFPDSSSVVHSTCVYMVTSSAGSILLGFAVSTMTLASLRVEAFLKKARGHRQSERERKAIFTTRMESLLNSRRKHLLFDIILGISVFPIGSFALGWWDALELGGNNLFALEPERCVVIGIFGGVVTGLSQYRRLSQWRSTEEEDFEFKWPLDEEK